MAVGGLMQVLGVELWSSGRTGSAVPTFLPFVFLVLVLTKEGVQGNSM